MTWRRAGARRAAAGWPRRWRGSRPSARRPTRARRAPIGGRARADADAELRELVSRLHVRPVFTAHPTEAARRTVLAKLRELAGLLDDLEAAGDDEAATARTMARLEELIDLLWQTDEIRVARPEVLDEARNAVYYFDELAAGPIPDVLEELTAQLARLGLEPPLEPPPFALGSWIGGDRDGNPTVGPADTRAVLALQHEHGARRAAALVDELRGDLSISTRIAPATPELDASLAADLDALPELDPRYRRLNAEEPYRLKLTCVREKLANTRRRIAAGRAHEPGRDYLDERELLAELALIQDSLERHRGGLVAGGRVARAMRAIAATGLRMATLDVREEASVHHARWPSSSTASARSAGPTRSSSARSGARCWRRSSPRAGRSPPIRRRSTTAPPAPTAPSPRSAPPRSSTARPASSPT